MILADPAGVAATPPHLRAVEAVLRDETGGCDVLFLGRAASALELAYRLAALHRPERQRPEVLMPAILCEAPAQAALRCGLTPRFADVDAGGLVSLASLEERATPDTCAVVVAHLFGHTADLEPIAAWCRARELLLIEDVAQAQGSVLPNGQPAGSLGDFVVYSFNRTKILESGGGALVVRDPAHRDALADVAPEKAPVESDGSLAASHRDLHHGLAGLLRARGAPPRDVSPLFLQALPAYEPLLWRPEPPPATLDDDWQELPARLGRRRLRAEVYAGGLADGPWTLLLGWRQSGVCWRFTLLVDRTEGVVAFSEAVRREGFHVSNLYWPLDQLFRPDDACPLADDFARRVINLFVDDTIDRDQATACCAALRKHEGMVTS